MNFLTMLKYFSETYLWLILWYENNLLLACCNRVCFESRESPVNSSADTISGKYYADFYMYLFDITAGVLQLFIFVIISDYIIREATAGKEGELGSRK